MVSREARRQAHIRLIHIVVCSPSAEYEFIDSIDYPPNTFTCSLSVNGETFIRNGASKKIARSMAAAEALKLMFGFIWDPSYGKCVCVCVWCVCVCVCVGVCVCSVV